MSQRISERRNTLPLVAGVVAAGAAAAALLAMLLARRRRMGVARREFAGAVQDFGFFQTEGLTGLTQAEAARLAPPRDLAAEQREDRRRFFKRVARTSIINIFSVNLIGYIIIMYALGSPVAALTSALVLLLNIAIRGVTMFDARRRLDDAMTAIAPRATVLRDGAPRAVEPDAIVPGDLVVARPGDAIFVAGELVTATGMTVATLTGADAPEPKQAGDTVARGAYCATGHGIYRAAEAGWRGPVAQAQRYDFLPARPSPFQRVLNNFLLILLAVNIIFAAALFVAAATNDINLVSAQGRNAFALLSNVAPTSLFFVLIVQYALGARRISTLGAMAYEARAIEDLAQVSLVCLSRESIMAGMSARVTLWGAGAADGESGAENVSAENGGAENGGAEDAAARRILSDALASIPIYAPAGARLDESLRGAPRKVVELASHLREAGWLGATFDEPDFRLTFVIGAPALLEPRLTGRPPQPPAADERKKKQPPARVMRLIERWNRLQTPLEERASALLRRREPVPAPREDALAFVCGYATEPLPLADGRGRPLLPRKLIPLARLEVYDDVRPDVAEALRNLQAADIGVRLFSPDEPARAAALAERLGLPSDAVLGGVAAEQQAAAVAALTEAGHVVAMVGSRVADIPAMAAAACGIALPSRSQAVTRAAQLVLLDGSLQPLQGALITGQRLVNGALGTLKLSLSQALAFALMLAIIPAFMFGVSPVHPTHAGMLSFFTIGLPNAVLASWSAAGRLSGAEIRRQLLRFALPIGITLALMGVGLFMRYMQGGATYFYAQLVVAYALLGAGWLRVLFLMPPNRFWAGASPVRGDPRVTMTVLAVAAVFVVFLMVPFLAGLYDLARPAWRDVAIVAGVVVAWALVLLVFWRVVWRQQGS